ncbi:unnamed protein product [Prorocentrum cordatum]|uniref:Uncharacterized protein n=1 Tax=Prorocentrum cordatum TaxID=2364126 RepID=A0ABN9V637_9DINO|nr:unnamed protein product [Polarella glacialis]
MVEMLPESWGAGSSGKSYAMLEPGAGLVVRDLQLRAAGGGQLNAYTLTLWFRVPQLPWKSDRLIVLDIPRSLDDPSNFDVPEEEQKTGKVFIWKNGNIAPEGMHNPRVLSRRKREKIAGARSSPATQVAGEWQLRFTITSDDGAAGVPLPQGAQQEVSERMPFPVPPDDGSAAVPPAAGEDPASRAPDDGLMFSMQITCDPRSGGVRVRPARGRRSADGSGEEVFKVMLPIGAERHKVIEDTFGGDYGGNERMLTDALWKDYLEHAIDVTGRSWEALGWRNVQHFRAIVGRKGDEVPIAIRQTEQAASAIAEVVRGLSLFQREPEVIEDRICAEVPKEGDMVRLSPNSTDTHFYDVFPYGALDKEGTMTGELEQFLSYDPSRALVWSPSTKDRQRATYYRIWNLERANGGKDDAQVLTDEDWLALPSTRANYVALQKAPPQNPIRKSAGWTARGRLDLQSLLLDVEGDDGCPAAYVDAALSAEEGKVPTLTGTWRAEDGSHGTVEGCKVLRESRLGGIWHFEVQSGGEPMDHAFNAWMTAHPAGAEADALASHTLRVSGVALAGPMLAEGGGKRPIVSGSFAALSRQLEFELRGGDARWSGGSFKGELAADQAFRGTWRHGDKTGRWLARHIGTRAVNASLRPRIDEGSRWDSKRCVVKIGLEKSGRRPVQGDKVKLSKMYKFYDGEGMCLKPGQIGKLVTDDRTTTPFLVEAPGGNTDWYADGAIVVVEDNDDSAMTPLGDSLEGAALFSRFPVREGTWYAEVEVLKLGKSQPCVGWGVIKKNPKKAERAAVIGGKTHVKLDIGEGAPKKKRKSKDDGKFPLTIFVLGLPKVEAGDEAEEKREEIMVPLAKLLDPHGPNERLMLFGEGGATEGVAAATFQETAAMDAATKALGGATFEGSNVLQVMNFGEFAKTQGDETSAKWCTALEEKQQEKQHGGGEGGEAEEKDGEKEKVDAEEEGGKSEDAAAKEGGEATKAAAEEEEEEAEEKDGKCKDDDAEAEEKDAESKEKNGEQPKKTDDEEEEGEGDEEDGDGGEDAADDVLWRNGESFGAPWMEGDIIGVLLTCGTASASSRSRSTAPSCRPSDRPLRYSSRPTRPCRS